MTAQRSIAPLHGTHWKARGASPSGLHAAVATAAIPAVILSSVALAQPASATPPHQVPVTRQVGPVIPVLPRAVVPAELVAIQVPVLNVTIATQTVPSDYTIRPGDTVGAVAARHGLSTEAVLKLNKLDVRTIIYPGQKIKLSGSAAPAATPAPAAPVAPTSGAATYTVKSGDTLGAIASRNGVSLQSILTANKLSMTSIIRPGQVLSLTGTVSAQATPPTAQSAPAPAPAPAAGSYTVKAGDTLGAIASRNGVRLTDLLAANRMSTSTVIYPGQKLALAGQGGAPAPAPTPAGDLVPSTFLGYQYPDRVVADANANKALLTAVSAPSPAEMRQIVADTARSMGVDPSLALAFALQESSFNQRAVSPANAIGTMQVIPSSGQWASDLVGRTLNLLDPYDNVTAGVAIIRSLVRTSPSLDIAIASYYQGQHSVQNRGMFEDTKRYVAAIKAHQRTFQ